MRRRIPLGIASDDTYLQSLINFTSTPETQHLGIFAKPVAAKRSSSFAADDRLPVSLAEMTVDRLQQQGNDAFKQQDLKRAVYAVPAVASHSSATHLSALRPDALDPAFHLIG